MHTFFFLTLPCSIIKWLDIGPSATQQDLIANPSKFYSCRGKFAKEGVTFILLEVCRHSVAWPNGQRIPAASSLQPTTIPSPSPHLRMKEAWIPPGGKRLLWLFCPLAFWIKVSFLAPTTLNALACQGAKGMSLDSVTQRVWCCPHHPPPQWDQGP